MATGYYLRHWGHYERDRDTLNPHERVSAAAFFLGLQALTQADIELLAYKYHTGNSSKPTTATGEPQTDIPLTDAVCAQHYNLVPAEYGKQRRIIETRLGQQITKAQQQYEDYQRHKLDEYALTVGGGWYIRSVSSGAWAEIILTCNPQQAKVYHGSTTLAQLPGFTVVKPPNKA